MGDLIRKLPTDQDELSREEKENFALLFGEEEKENFQQLQQPVLSPPSEQQRVATPIPENPHRPMPVPTTFNPSPSSPVLLKKELFQVSIFAAIFFVFQFPSVSSLFQNYIPMCKSEMTRYIVKAVVFGIVLLVLINFRYIQK